MEQYNVKRAEKVNTKLEQLRALKAENPTFTNKQFAEMMDVSTKTIQRLTKKL